MNWPAARIGPMVWELDGPMPTLKISKMEIDIIVALIGVQ
jgi:hypothetical protein